MASTFEPTVVPADKAMGWQTTKFIGKATISLTTPIELIMPDGKIVVATPTAGQTVAGEVVKIDELRYANWFNPRVGNLFMAWNGRFGQPLIKQNPGRMVIYATKHPTLGWMLGGADEPREHCNGAMFTAAGGYDPASGSELAAIKAMPDGEEKTKKLKEYEKAAAAREVLQEMGLVVTDLQEVGKGLSNRSIYMTDLTNPDVWNGETYYVVLVPFEMVAENKGKFAINLPDNKEGDVQPAPEWSGIKKLEFEPALKCFASLDSVAVSGFAKAYAWLVEKFPLQLTVAQALEQLKLAILAEQK